MECLIVYKSTFFSVHKGLGCVRVQENQLIACFTKTGLVFEEPLALSPLLSQKYTFPNATHSSKIPFPCTNENGMIGSPKPG